MKVKFCDVGRSKACFTTECKQLTPKWIYRQIKPYCLSRNIWYSINGNHGFIWGGMNKIGEFEVEEEKE